MTEHDFKVNSERYSEYDSLNQKLIFINEDLGKVGGEESISKIFIKHESINIEMYSHEAENELREYLKAIMYAEIERIKKRMEEL